MPQTTHRSFWTIWFSGTVASIVLSWLVFSVFAYAGYRVLIRYWLIAAAAGSASSAVAAWVASRPTQQGVLSKMQKSAEAIQTSAETFQQAGEQITHSMDTFLVAVNDSAERTQKITATAEQYAQDLHQLYEALSQQGATERGTDDRSSAIPAGAVPNSRFIAPRAVPPQSEQTKQELDPLALFGEPDLQFPNADDGDYWGTSTPGTEHSNRRAG